MLCDHAHFGSLDQHHVEEETPPSALPQRNMQSPTVSSSIPHKNAFVGAYGSQHRGLKQPFTFCPKELSVKMDKI